METRRAREGLSRSLRVLGRIPEPRTAGLPAGSRADRRPETQELRGRLRLRRQAGLLVRIEAIRDRALQTACAAGGLSVRGARIGILIEHDWGSAANLSPPARLPPPAHACEN